MLEVRGLGCAPRGAPAIRNVDLQVSAGELVIVFGPNGSGKGTLCRCLGLLLPHEQGEVHVDGRRLSGAPWNAARAGIMVVPKGQRVFPDMTVRDNLRASPLAPAGAAGRLCMERVLVLFPRLGVHLSQIAGNLSGGEQQMVAIGRAMLSSPRILVIDEPSRGLSPKLAAEVHAALHVLSADGIAVLITEEERPGTGRRADRAYRMERGAIAPAPEPPSASRIVTPALAKDN